MMVHHGETSVMIMSSSTRGRVAGSSFCVNGRSRSRESGLYPLVCPVKMVAHVSHSILYL